MLLKYIKIYTTENVYMTGKGELQLMGNARIRIADQAEGTCFLVPIETTSERLFRYEVIYFKYVTFTGIMWARESLKEAE
jgi:hypothetical protein